MAEVSVDWLAWMEALSTLQRQKGDSEKKQKRQLQFEFLSLQARQRSL